MTYESKDRQWFALDAGTGSVYALGDCGDFEAADAAAVGLEIDAVWLADAETAKQWMQVIAKRFEETDMTDKLRLTLGELESLAHHEHGHNNKEYLLDYIGWMWCLLQYLSPDFKADLIRDYGTYIEETKENA